MPGWPDLGDNVQQIEAHCRLRAVPRCPGLGLAQIPTGTISGVVQDQASAVIRGADVQAVSRATGHMRTTTTGERGEYSIPALLPGDYDVTIEAEGFQRTVRAVTVEAGSTTTADFVVRGAIWPRQCGSRRPRRSSVSTRPP